MTEQNQIVAIAELDGWTGIGDGNWCKGPSLLNEDALPPYLSSRDAIVPVIEKQSRHIATQFVAHLQCVVSGHQVAPQSQIGVMLTWSMLTATPPQLCEALLRATGKWKE